MPAAWSWTWTRRRAQLARAVLGVALLAVVLPPAAHARGRLGHGVADLARAARAGDLAAARARAAALGMRVRPGPLGGLVPVVLELDGGSAACDEAWLGRLGARIEATSPSYVRALVPLRRLDGLAALPNLVEARAPARPRAAGGVGGRVSESVALTGAEALQLAGIDGSGVAIAIVDLGFEGLSVAMAGGELPSIVIADLPGPSDDDIESITDHGTDVAEHAADMAPGATIHVILVSDEVDLDNSAVYCRDNGIRVANHSVAWFGASYYDGTGPVSGIINRSHDDDGVLWTVASGNSARDHWRGGWVDADGDDIVEVKPGSERLFLVRRTGTATIFLNWNQYDRPASEITDIDVYAFRRNQGKLTQVGEAILDNTRTGVPLEILEFDMRANALDEYFLEIHRFGDGTTAGLDLTIFSFDHEMAEPVLASSLLDPACAPGAFSVGAIDQADYALADPPAEPYSGRGPTNDGRPAPDLVAPDGTTSLTSGTQGAFGTSFASPTAAGAAALCLQQRPEMTVTELAATLRGLAVDTGAPGPDTTFGAGRLHLEPLAPPLVEVPVRALGEGGWESGDTRFAGTLAFAESPDTFEPARGALRLESPASADKATLDQRAFFAARDDDPFAAGIAFEYAWYRVSGGVAAPALKLGIDTSEANGTSAERFETAFDKILVYERYLQAPSASGTWNVEEIDYDQGRFWMVNLTPGGSVLPATSQAVTRTLRGWFEEVWSLHPETASARIVSLQVGIGSGNPGQLSFVDALTYTDGASTIRWDFEAAAP